MNSFFARSNGKHIGFLMILLFSFSFFSASGYAQKLTLKRDKVSLRSLLEEIERQSGYFFLYDSKLLENNRGVSVDFQEHNVDEVMEYLGGIFGFEHRKVDNTITLIPREPGAVVQDRIEGVIRLRNTDTGQEQLAQDANIQIKGTSVYARTDDKGHFTIPATSGNILVITHIGYRKQEILLTDLKSLQIVLEPAVSTIDEVVISGGYGIKESKENQIGSAVLVASKDLERRPVYRLDRMLEGLVPGFEIQTQDANNSSVRPRYSSRIRGEASVSGIASNEPLWIIDGIKMNTGGPTNLIPGLENSISPLSFLNPEDIESITVLKDASATTIYGANGSNGVILITTKKGTGKSKVNYAYRSGFQQITDNRFQVLSGDEYNAMLMEMGYHEYINDVHTDWYDLYYRNGLTQQHNLSFSGSEASGLSHYVSAGIYNEKMTIIANTIQRFTLRANIEKDFGKRLKFHLITGGSYNINNMFNPSDEFYMRRPNISAYNPDGTYALRDDRGKRIFNSLAEAEQNDNAQRAFSVLANGGLTINILDGLSFRSENGLDLSATHENQYSSMRNLSGMAENGYARKAMSNVLSWISSNTLFYDKNIAAGELNMVVGMEASESVRKSTNATGSRFANDWIREVSYAPDEYRRGGSSGSENSSLSYFGRVNYVWDKRYAVTASMRRDGDSNFGSSVKWGTFAAAGASWTVSNEHFWNQDNPAVSFLKFKATYGNNGNARFASNYAKGVYSFDSTHGYDGQPGAVMTRGVNDVLKWENTYIFNTGMDIGLFDRVHLALEYYHNKTVNLIDNAIVSSTSGQRRLYQNAGKVQNQGLEMILEGRRLRLGPVEWSPKLIASGNRNKVLELPEGQDRVAGTTIRREGYPVGSVYLVRWAGVDPRDGAPLWYDLNGNLTRVHNAVNRVIIGDSSPELTGSFLNSFEYNGFSLSVSLLFTKGGLAFSSLRRNAESDGLNLLEENQSKNSLDYWKNPGDLALNPRLSAISTSSTLNSSRHLHDRTHLRINNASIGYRLRDAWLERVRLTSANVYVQLDNIGFWTPYQVRKDRNTYRNSFEPWPEVRTVSVGTSFSF